MTDLSSLVSPAEGPVRLERTPGINNHGQVLVTLVIPEPQTYAMLLAGLALVGFIARLRKTA